MPRADTLVWCAAGEKSGFMEGAIESYLIGEGIRATENGRYKCAFEEIEKIFQLLPGTAAEFSESIIEALEQSDVVVSAEVEGNQFHISFHLRYCPYIK